MKLTHYLFIFIVIAAAACKKDTSDSASFSVSKTLPVNSCNPFACNGINYSICLDSVVNDSRCPHLAECVWAGIAKAKFTFKVADEAHHFYLHTYAAQGMQKDTVINGFKIEFIELIPHPELNREMRYSDYKAIVSVKKQ
jgi:hypothetical protein